MLRKLGGLLEDLGQPIRIDIGALKNSNSATRIERATLKIRQLFTSRTNPGGRIGQGGPATAVLVDDTSVRLWNGRSEPEIAARQLAVNSWANAKNQPSRGGYRPATGIGICASNMEISIAVHDLESTSHSTIETAPSAVSPQRLEQELAKILCLLLTHADGGHGPPASFDMRDRSVVHPDARNILAGTVDVQKFGGHQLAVDFNLSSQTSNHPTHLISGAFQPIHQGHIAMAELLELEKNNRVGFELAIVNADKPMMDHFEINSRIQQDFGNRPVFLTAAANFVDKSKLFPNTIFVVGVDTITRVADLRFYGESVKRRDQSIETFRQNGCRFLVLGRANPQCFQTLNECQLPAHLIDLCDGVAENVFRRDISSSHLRASHRPHGG